MKRIVVLMAALLASWQCGAQPSTFDPATGELDIPCLTTADGRQVVGVNIPYYARLRRTGASPFLALEETQRTLYGDDCSGHFDTAAQLYTDIVNIGDTAYYVLLRRDTGNVFSIESATLRGPATTSLWVARNGTNTVYLAGAIHILRQKDYPLPRAFDEAYAKASVLYFEIDMDNPAETGESLTPAQFLQLQRDPQGETLAQVLSPATYGRLRDYLLSRWDVAIENVNVWSAQLVVNTFRSRELEQTHGFSAGGVDEYLVNKAKAERKEIFGLETTASQYGVLHALDEDREEAVVRSFLDTVATGAYAVGAANQVQLWRRGDTTQINLFQVEPMLVNDYADYLVLYANRHNAWVPQIEALLRSPATEMVVVGLSHMVGDDGLLAQLRARGYSVEKY